MTPIQEDFVEILKTQDQVLINDEFVNKLNWDGLTLGDVIFMIDCGADARCDEDLPFVESCCQDDTEIPLYFLNIYGADINAHNGEALYNALLNNKYNLMEILLQNGIMVSNEVIERSLDDESFLKILIKYGLEIQRISKIFTEKILIKKLNKDKEIIKCLINNNVDFNEIFIEMSNKWN